MSHDFPWIALPSIAWAVLWASMSSLGAQDAGEGQSNAAADFFETRIRPILVERCVSCHGAEKQWADLRLDHAEGAKRGGESGPVLVASNPNESELYRRLVHADRDVRMPPEESGPALTEQQIGWFRQWIKQGAVWPASNLMMPASTDDLLRNHWAFQPLSSIEPTPTVESGAGDGWGQHPVDAFIEAKRRELGLPNSPRADARTLVRRVHYDLTGLPPDFATVECFNSDPSSDAWERMIDSLLASPRFGEHWGRLWLDVARYSDTKGYVYAREERFYVHAPLYRDWVIGAWNQGMRFDRFLELQIAADRLPDSTKEDWVALGFLTLGRRFLGVEADIVDDRIDVVSRGLLGLTVGCARCHDHKYDPISTAEYYSLFGIFQNTHEQLVALKDQEGLEPENARKLQEKKDAYQTFLRAQKDEAEARIRARVADYLMAQNHLSDYPDVSFSQLSSKEDLLPAVVHRWESYLHRAALANDPLFVPWSELSRVGDHEFVAMATARLEQWKSEPGKVHPVVLQSLDAVPRTVRELAERYQVLFARAWQEFHAEPQAANPGGSRSWREEFGEEAWKTLVRFLTSSDSPCVIPTDHMANMEWLWDNGTVVQLWKKQSEMERLLLDAPFANPHTVAIFDNPSVFEPRVFRRGNPANKGADVPRGLPRVLGSASKYPIESGSGRLQLARAVIDPRNPLTARVWVNRVWKQFFGAGLVTTPSDFGVRATPPSHPELLDYLAREFIAHDWDNRWLHRLILTSKTYQQSSLGPDRESDKQEAQSRDPENRYLWKMNRKRLSFEAMRDSMLVNSGTLDGKQGGKSQDLFEGDGTVNRRRTIYGTIDRQYLPTVLSVFDFANPDMHSPQRSETTVPQQALFALNHPFVAAQARGIVTTLRKTLAPQGRTNDMNATLDLLVARVLQRTPTAEERSTMSSWLQRAEQNNATAEDVASAESAKAWSYGYGRVDAVMGRVVGFAELPYRTTTHRQGGAKLPDAKLGWVHITARTIHAGNDLQHSAIRRWTSPGSGTVSIRSVVKHVHPQGDGVRGIILSSRHGILHSQVIAHGEEAFDVEEVAVEEGDTIDFIAQLHGSLSYEDLEWVPDVTWMPHGSAGERTVERRWNGEKDFPRALQEPLTPLEQLAQVLLVSNEAFFVD